MLWQPFRMNISAITPTIDADVSGVDLSNFDPDSVSAIKDALLAHHVLVFRDQVVTRDQHKAFGGLLGLRPCAPRRQQRYQHHCPSAKS